MMGTGEALRCLAYGELACLFLEPDSGLDSCQRILLSCFRPKTSALMLVVIWNAIRREREVHFRLINLLMYRVTFEDRPRILILMAIFEHLRCRSTLQRYVKLFLHA